MPDCPECGFSYVAGIPSNTRAHRKYHDETMKGFPAKPLHTDRVVWEEPPYRMTVVNHSSPLMQKKRAEKAGVIANRDLRYDFKPYSAGENSDERDVHLFLLHHQDRIVGLLVVEKRSHIWKSTWEEYERHVFAKISGDPPMRSVRLAWLNKSHRRKGLARRLVTEAANYFNIDVRGLGWFTPFTDLGEKMVRRLCPEWLYIAK